MRVLLGQHGGTGRKFDTAVGCGTPRSSAGRHPTVCCFAPSLSSLLPPSHSAVTWPVLERSFPLYFLPYGAAAAAAASCRMCRVSLDLVNDPGGAAIDTHPGPRRSENNPARYVAPRPENEFSEKGSGVGADGTRRDKREDSSF